MTGKRGAPEERGMMDKQMVEVESRPVPTLEGDTIGSSWKELMLRCPHYGIAAIIPEFSPPAEIRALTAKIVFEWFYYASCDCLLPVMIQAQEQIKVIAIAQKKYDDEMARNGQGDDDLPGPAD